MHSVVVGQLSRVKMTSSSVSVALAVVLLARGTMGLGVRSSHGATGQSLFHVEYFDGPNNKPEHPEYSLPVVS